MAEQRPSPVDDGRILSPRLRIFLYGAAGIMFTLWLSMQFFGAAGFVAFAIGMIAAQVAFRWRPSLNAAFFAGLVTFAVTLIVWTSAVGPPRASNRNATETAVATRENG